MSKKTSTTKVNFKETLWKSAEKLRNQMDAAEYKHVVLGLIFLKYISDTFDIQKNKIIEKISNPKSDLFISEDIKVYEKELEDRDYYTQDNVFWVPKSSRWEKLRAQAKQPDIGSIIDLALVKIENENKSLQGKLDKRFGRIQLTHGKLGELIDLISTIGFDGVEESATDLLGEVYEYFLGQFALAEGKKAGQYYTPNSVVKTLVKILSPFKGRVYDPCCGSGGMFVQSKEFIKAHGGNIDDISIYGQESNSTTLRLAQMNLAIRGISADLGKINADTFSNDQFPDLKFDFIISNPPFNVSDWNGEKYENDVRWKYGKPPIGNANYAWLQHIIWKLNEQGSAGVVLANSSLTSTSNNEDVIRKNMIEEDIVESIISLPSQIFINSKSTFASFWILKKQKPKLLKNKILFIDAKKNGEMIDRVSKIIGKKDMHKITNSVLAWRNNSKYENITGFCKSADLEEIREKNYTLNPSVYVGFEKAKHDPQEFDKEYNRLLENLKTNFKKSQSLENTFLEQLSLIKKNDK